MGKNKKKKPNSPPVPSQAPEPQAIVPVNEWDIFLRKVTALEEDCHALQRKRANLEVGLAIEGKTEALSRQFSTLFPVHEIVVKKLDALLEEASKKEPPRPIKAKLYGLAIKYRGFEGWLHANSLRLAINPGSARCYFDAMMKLDKYCDILNFHEDDLLQTEAILALVYMLDSAPLNGAKLQLLPDLIERACEKFKPNGSVVELLYTLMTATIADDPFLVTATPSRRTLFWRTYKTRREQLEEALKNDESNLALAMEYACINFYAYQFKLFVDAYRLFGIAPFSFLMLTDIPQVDSKDDTSIDEFLRLDATAQSDYIYPSLAALARTNSDKFKWQASQVHYIKRLNLLFTTAHYDLSHLFCVWADRRPLTAGGSARITASLGAAAYPSRDFHHPWMRLAHLNHFEINKMLLDIVSHPALASAMRWVFQSDSKDPLVARQRASLMENQLLQLVDSAFNIEGGKTQIVAFIQKQEEDALALANHEALALLEWEDERKKATPRYVLVKKKKPKSVAKGAKSTAPSLIAAEEEIDVEGVEGEVKQVETTNQFLVRADQDWKGKRFDDAIVQYAHAYQAAVTSGEFSEQRDALDGEMFLRAKSIDEALIKIMRLIIKRKSDEDEPLTLSELQSIESSIAAVEANSAALSNSFESFKTLIMQRDLPISIRDGVAYTQAKIPTSIREIHQKIDDVKQQYRLLQDWLDENRENFIFKLGRKSAVEKKESNPSEERIYELGKNAFKEAGGKRGASPFTKERELLKKFRSRLDALSVPSLPEELVVEEKVQYALNLLRQFKSY